MAKCSIKKMPKCHPVSCVDGKWKCGAISDPAYLACDGTKVGEECKYTPQGGSKGVSGICTVGHPFELDLLATSAVAASEHKASDDENEADGNDESERHEYLGQVDELDQSRRNLKCAVPHSPKECQDVIIELEHQFTESYVSLTRMVEEYSIVSHSTVCEDTVEQEYEEESSGVQDDANEVCEEVQGTLAKLEKFKFEYQSTVKTEHAMETTIKNLVKQCGQLDSTEIHLETVKSTLDALGDCPGIGDIQFQLPTWVGDWTRFRQKRKKSNKWNDKMMLNKCKNKFGDDARVAEVSEIDSRSIDGMPETNTASYPLLGACPECKGKRMPGLSKSGFGRICWDAGAKLGRRGRRRDCASGAKAVLCVYDKGPTK